VPEEEEREEEAAWSRGAAILTDGGGWGCKGGNATLITAKGPGASPSGCKAALLEPPLGSPCNSQRQLARWALLGDPFSQGWMEQVC
jgi:hypothetical protein